MRGSGNELEVEAVVPAVCNIAIRYDNVSTCMQSTQSSYAKVNLLGVELVKRDLGVLVRGGAPICLVVPAVGAGNNSTALSK